MFFWYVGLSVFGVATIFRSVGIDYRLIAVGSLLPLVLDLPFGYRAYGYTLLFAVALLVVVMVGTIGRPRLVRRRWLCLPIGVFCGLVLSGAFAQHRAVLVAVPRHDVHRTTRCCPRGGSWSSRRSSGSSCAGCSSASTTSTCRAPATSSSAPAASRGMTCTAPFELSGGYSARTGMPTRTGWAGRAWAPCGVDDEAALARTVGDRHAERLEQRVVFLGRRGRSS